MKSMEMHRCIPLDHHLCVYMQVATVSVMGTWSKGDVVTFAPWTKLIGMHLCPDHVCTCSLAGSNVIGDGNVIGEVRWQWYVHHLWWGWSRMVLVMGICAHAKRWVHIKQHVGWWQIDEGGMVGASNGPVDAVTNPVEIKTYVRWDGCEESSKVFFPWVGYAPEWLCRALLSTCDLLRLCPPN